jgi:hypothetical protein
MDDINNNKIKEESNIKSNENTNISIKEVTSGYQTRKKFIDFAKIGERLSLTGSNCHYCKTIMTVKDSNACRYIPIIKEFKENLAGKISKKKNCNKKFCFDCLEKHFPLHWNTRLSKDWKCPCCTADCNCSQCRKLILKEKKETESILLTCDSNSNASEGKEIKKSYNDKTNSTCFKEEFFKNENKVS